ncbi:MAG: DDE-type integrase/transposase/recombinase [Nitrososphaeraceae archaeon]
MTATNQREQLGQVIATAKRAIKRMNSSRYLVKSQSGSGKYVVSATKIGWVCSCLDHKFRGVKCKHIYAVEISYAIRKEVEVTRIEPLVNVNECIYCKSVTIVKDGLRHNKHGDIQKFNCKTCNKYFTINIGFERMKHNPQGITTAMQLYFSGESLRNTSHSLKLIGMDVTHQTVYNWIKKYTKLMQTYLNRIIPKVGDAWRTDELHIKVHGNIKYMYALMDDQTRFWIAQQVVDAKFSANIAPLFRKAKLIAGKRPSVLISDGAPNFNDAFKHEFFNRRKPRSRHIKHIRMQGDHNNNKMERLNGEVRDREKVMRSLKKSDTPILTGYQLFHNYMRPHMALDGKTPAEMCGIEIGGDNKWKTIIENAKNDKSKRS